MKKILFLIACCIIHAGISAQDWSLTGNAGTISATNFIGTTDARSLMFKVNNQRSGLIDFAFAKANTSFGFQALLNTTGNNNAAFGYKASFSNTTGIYNSALGAYALYFNTNGYSNVAMGVGALYRNTSSDNLVAIGDSALYNNGVGALNYYEAIGNTAVGSKALYANTTGYYNTANGYNALRGNTSGVLNTAMGYTALFANTTGGGNTATGYAGLYSNTSGGANTAIGDRALYSNTIGFFNTSIGYGGLYSNTSGNQNVANGSYSLYSNSTGSYNTASGSFAMHLNTTGSNNVALGREALYTNQTGSKNIAIGSNSLYKSQQSRCIAIGDSALATSEFEFPSNPARNIAIGDKAMSLATSSGHDNIALGCESLNNLSSGNYNIGIGVYALRNFYNGYGNVTIGTFTSVIANGDYNTMVGYGTRSAYTELYGSSAFGWQAAITADYQVRLGNSSVSSIGGYANWTNISDGRVKKNIKHNVPGLAFINKLKPVTYNLDLDAADKIIQRSDIKEKDDIQEKPTQQAVTARNAKQQVLYTGFVAQDVENAAKELNYDFSGVDAAKNDKDLYGLRYAEFVVPLVKAVQELSKINDDKDAKIEVLEKRLEKLEAMMNVQPLPTNDKIRTVNLSSAILEQNVPNPFNNTTIINYTLPQQYISAKLIITDKSGKTLKEINVSGSGKGNIMVDATSISSGAYQYSLYVDGKLIDTKQMVLAK